MSKRITVSEAQNELLKESNINDAVHDIVENMLDKALESVYESFRLSIGKIESDSLITEEDGTDYSLENNDDEAWYDSVRENYLNDAYQALYKKIYESIKDSI